MRDEIIEIIKEVTKYRDLEENPNIDLIEEDILDSLAFIDLITKLEETFNIEIQPTQIPSDTWRTVDNIVEMVEKEVSNDETSE